MTFPSRGPIGGWQYGDTLSHLALSELDGDHTSAVDGAAGGTYNAISQDLTLATVSGKNVGINSLLLASPADGGNITTLHGLEVGAGLGVDGSAHVVGSLTVDGGGVINSPTGQNVGVNSLLLASPADGGNITAFHGIDVLGGLSVALDASVTGSIIAGGAAINGEANIDIAAIGDLQADHGSVTNALEVGGTLTVDGSTTMHSVSAGAVSCTGNVSTTGSFIASGNIGCSGSIGGANGGFSGSLACNGLMTAGRYQELASATLIGGNVNTTVDANVVHTVVIRDDVLTATRVYSIANGSDGMELEFVVGSGAHTIQITGIDSTVGRALNVNISTFMDGGVGYAKFKKVAGAWVLLFQS